MHLAAGQKWAQESNHSYKLNTSPILETKLSAKIVHGAYVDWRDCFFEVRFLDTPYSVEPDWVSN